MDKKIKEKLGNTSVPPSPELWSKIDASLSAQESKKGIVLLPFLQSYAKYGIAAAIAFLLGGVVTYTMMDSLNGQETPIMATEDTEGNVKDIATDINKEDILYAEEESTENKEEVTNEKTLAANNEQDDTVTEIEEENISTTTTIRFEESSNELVAYDNLFQNYEEELKTYSLSLIENNNEDYILEEEIDAEPVFYRVPLDKNRTGYQGFWFGPEVSYESSFSNGNYYKGQGMGLSFGYDFAKKWGIQSGIRYAMIYKQFTVNSDEGENLSYQSNLSSVHVPLMLRWKHTMVGGRVQRPTSLNVALGVDYGYNKSNDFHQLGGVAAVEYDVFMRNDIMLTFGMRAGFSKNLNYSPIIVPEAVGQYNYQLGIYTALRFKGAGKRK
ncbi:MAG: outer membrane beta-barrel protein [Chitinophagales bacterium]